MMDMTSRMWMTLGDWIKDTGMDDQTVRVIRLSALRAIEHIATSSFASPCPKGKLSSALIAMDIVL